ncbi:MAG: hypothetical protein KGL15_02040 [Acidobacteriota bacterium]|nr:hypothetical protein [Acidobacteriota bacterium]
MKRFSAALSASLLASLAFSATALAGTVTTGSDLPNQLPYGYQAPANDGLGVGPGKIKHVWVIVLENKAFNASFTPLEGTQGQYLSQLPAQGALLTNYYGTGHSSLDNYLSMVSGQAPISDNQSDCPAYRALSGSIDMSGSLKTNPDYGQFVSGAGADAPAGDNGCVYPSSVPTLFNQLDSSHISWKVYAQDLNYGLPTTAGGNGDGHNAGDQYCGAPDSSVGPAPSATQRGSYPNPSSADDANVAGLSTTDDLGDQYVAKHNPLAWFESLLPSSMGGTGAGNCDSTLAPLFGPQDQLYQDLQQPRTTPEFSYIVPNNCSNGHDSVCSANNLSGGFGVGASSQVPNPPVNYTGGTYAESQFLAHIIPEIERSPAFQDNGLIVVTYDEAYPAFTWQNSFANSALLPSTAFGSLITDQAGETLYGRSVNWEPTGPNATLVTSATGQELTPGPGYNENIDRPASANGPLVGCSNGTNLGNGYSTFTSPADGGCLLGGGNTASYSSSTVSGVSIAAGSSVVNDAKATLKNEGQQVTFASAVALTDGSDSSYAGPVYVGDVTDTAENAAKGGTVDVGAFHLVDASGKLVTVNGGYSGSITLGALSTATDPFYDASDPTMGGGDAGAVLISPYIRPGTVSNTYYNHYSLLRSLEDIFQVKHGAPGLDGGGHVGYAAQPGLAPFGPDVFTHDPGWGRGQSGQRGH